MNGLFDASVFTRPKFASATTVQCEVYRQLSNLGIEVLAEYKSYGSRFDLVVIKDGKIVAIIETKKYAKPGPNRGKQYEKYKSYGIPLIYTRGMEQVADTIQEVKKLLNMVDKDL